MNDDNLGFIRATVRVGDALRTVARFTCTGCGEIADVTIGPRLIPELLAKKVRQSGWHAHPDRKSKAMCPACVAKPKGEPEPMKDDLMSSTPINHKVVQMPVSPPPPVMKPATADQRVQIRNLLDKHFDDSVGAYLDDMDDQRIAELVGVPRLIIEQMREIAYGPIRADPELLAMRNELAHIKAELTAGRQDMVAMQDRLRDLEGKTLTLASRIEKRITGRAV